MTRIMVVDDHHMFRTGVEAVLNTAGIEVAASIGDGDTALESIEAIDPDIVLLDIRMPGRDGVSILKAIRQASETRKVIILATELHDDQLVAVMQERVDGIVFKHATETQLFEAIEAVSKGKRHIDGDLLDRAFHLAMSEPKVSQLDLLTKREREIAEAVARGMRNREVGELLNMTEGTVKVCLHSIFSKLKIDNRTELALLMTPRAH